MQKKLLIVTELFKIAVDDFGTKKCALYSWLLDVTSVNMSRVFHIP